MINVNKNVTLTKNYLMNVGISDYSLNNYGLECFTPSICNSVESNSFAVECMSAFTPSDERSYYVIISECDSEVSYSSHSK